MRKKGHESATVLEKTSHRHRALFRLLFIPTSGDYAEIPEECPATTTCPVVCVANLTECPTACGDGLSLCATGNCETDCAAFEVYEVPCACDALGIACPKVVDLFPVCFERFQNFYDNNTACVDAQVEAVPLLSFTGPWFLACYFVLAGVSILVMLWCFLNQKIFPVGSSTMTLESTTKASSGVWTQTGYKTHPIGFVIHILVNLTFLAIQVLLFATTIFYYMQQGSITRWPLVFQDEAQVLKAFEIVWMVGFVWTIAFRYPSTGAYALFLRRCDLGEATHVAVVAPIKSIEVTEVSSLVGRTASMAWAPFDFVLRVIFSHPYDRPGLETIFCPIENDPQTNTRSILHRMRRYVYSEETSGFIPCMFCVGTTLGDLLDQCGGLSTDEVILRRGKSGPNVIALLKPTILGSIYKEFSKTFYLYQNFMVWSWANFFYYYMAIVNTFVRVSGGLVVAYFQYVSDSVLFQLSHVEGDVE